MSKVPNFYKFKINGDKIIDYEAKDINWSFFMIDSYFPEEGGYTITLRVNEMINFTNSWGIMIGLVETHGDISNITKYEDTHVYENYIGSSRLPGIGLPAMHGKFYGKIKSKSSSFIDSVRYGKGDEIKMNVYKNNTVEFFKNDVSLHVFSLEYFTSFVPLVSLSSTSQIEIIDISLIED
eukprot:TRINITY_DN355_c0_g8_i1.p1 TRINITY_DN355_c0_g8~~TRINITY_DN355_c0_g8_i1.p1  ORF type:complete len:180 (+),score=33.37 TRINITY_DN355_c0_g8_i1:587-1126(+)